MGFSCRVMLRLIYLYCENRKHGNVLTNLTITERRIRVYIYIYRYKPTTVHATHGCLAMKVSRRSTKVPLDLVLSCSAETTMIRKTLALCWEGFYRNVGIPAKRQRIVLDRVQFKIFRRKS